MSDVFTTAIPLKTNVVLQIYPLRMHSFNKVIIILFTGNKSENTMQNRYLTPNVPIKVGTAYLQQTSI